MTYGSKRPAIRLLEVCWTFAGSVWRCSYEIRSLTAAICHFCWVRRFVDGIEGIEGIEADPSFTIAATDSSNSTLVHCLPDNFLRFPYWRVSVSGYQFPAIRRPFQYSATGANILRMKPYQSKEDPSICLDLRECLLDARYGSSNP